MRVEENSQGLVTSIFQASKVLGFFLALNFRKFQLTNECNTLVCMDIFR